MLAYLVLSRGFLSSPQRSIQFLYVNSLLWDDSTHSAELHILRDMAISSEYTVNDTIPTYEESTRSGIGKSSLPVLPLTLTQQLASTRHHRIDAIISAYIDPLLQSQALAGLFKTILVLVPSNTISLQRRRKSLEDIDDMTGGFANTTSTENGEEVVGFRSEDYVQLIRLHGEEYTLEFWRQPAVIKELNSSLRVRLQGSGHRMAEETTARVPQPAAVAADPETMLPKTGFFRRKPSKNSPPVPAKPDPLPESTWRYLLDENLSPGYIRTRVELKGGVLESRNRNGIVRY